MRARLLAPFLLMSACAAHATQQSPIEDAATQPLRDTRIADERIPEVLQLAASAPYSTRGTERCSSIAEQIRRLDAALGPDADAPGTEPGRGATLAAAGIRAAINSLVPGLGLVRLATGADRHQRRVEAAILAGSLRRSYLKGLGASRGCAPPAAPSTAARQAVPQLRPAEPEE